MGQARTLVIPMDDEFDIIVNPKFETYTLNYGICVLLIRILILNIGICFGLRYSNFVFILIMTPFQNEIISNRV